MSIDSISVIQRAGAASLDAAQAKLQAEAESFERALAGAVGSLKGTLDSGRNAAAANAGSADPVAKLNEAAHALEAYFVNMLIKKMRGTAMKNELFEESPGQKMFSELGDEAYSKEISKRGVFGIGAMIVKQYREHAEAFEKAREAAGGGKE